MFQHGTFIRWVELVQNIQLLQFHQKTICRRLPLVCSDRGSEMALNGRTAVVTGAAMGIGKAITKILLQNGAKVTFDLSLKN